MRSHIENIPIPAADASTQAEIIALTDKLISGLQSAEAEKVYDELDLLVSKAFNLDSNEIEIINKAVEGDNKFLA